MTDRKLSSVFVSKQGKDMTKLMLPEKLTAEGVPAVYKTIPVDLEWLVDGKPVMYDIKTPSDLIASAEDGRLHSQMESMKSRECVDFGFLVYGTESFDGVTVGYAKHAWPLERYDNLKWSLQQEGASIVHARDNRLVQRIAGMYKRLGRESTGSWHAPTPHRNLSNRYTDKTYRTQVELLMGLPGMGEKRANDLLDRWPIMDILGITPEGLGLAHARWMKVPGIGAKLGAGWEAFLLEDFSSPILRQEVVSA